MSWVEDRFKEREAVNRGVTPLWHSVRDSIGQAGTDYNGRVRGTPFQIKSTDCTSRSSLCMWDRNAGTSAFHQNLH